MREVTRGETQADDTAEVPLDRNMPVFTGKTLPCTRKNKRCRYREPKNFFSATNLRFADDIDGSAEEEEELANLVERLDKASTTYSTEISAEKTKLMTNNIQWHQHRDQSEWTEA